jgi:hypothetical protein
VSSPAVDCAEHLGAQLSSLPGSAGLLTLPVDLWSSHWVQCEEVSYSEILVSVILHFDLTSNLFSLYWLRRKLGKAAPEKHNVELSRVHMY